MLLTSAESASVDMYAFPAPTGTTVEEAEHVVGSGTRRRRAAGDVADSLRGAKCTACFGVEGGRI